MNGQLETIADYRLIRHIGEGSHGDIYLATPPSRLGLGVEHVAVKVLRALTNDDAFRRTSRELRTFAAVKSPYLVGLYDAGQDGGSFFYAMEYFTLGSVEKPSRPLDRAETIRALAHAARAAHALHEAGVAHRAIKPGNVLIHEEGAKLSDLGLAQTFEPGKTTTGLGGVESVEYMDPSVLRGERASRATDIWSLGMTLHRALSGHGVYGELSGSDPLLTIRTVLTSEPELSNELSDHERRVVSTALAPDPADRQSTADELADQIEALN